MNAAEYLQANKHHFWQWDEGGEVISIWGSYTIGYRAYVFELLKHLSTEGLPPFGTVLLTIAATNTNAKESIEMVQKILLEYIADERAEGNTVNEVRKIRAVHDAFRFLRLLGQVPAEYMTKTKRKLLLMTIFKDAHNNLNPQKSAKIISSLDDTLFNNFSVNNKLGNLIHRELRPLYLLHRKFKTVDEILAAIAEMPDIEEDIEIEYEEKTKDNEPKDFVEQLLEHPKTFEVGALVKRIWSGLNIPTRSLLPSEQPLGGVSDLTNKGDFDRLLISEYANDDIVFLSRLANNEALYFHRETPPADNKLERVMLMDISLKNWGTPKTMAHAVMLAIANHPKTEDVECKGFVVGDVFQSIKINTINEVIDSLAYVDTCLHPTSGLEAFFRAKIADAGSEVFFITTPSTLKNPDMMKTLTQYQSNINYLITCDLEGEIEIYRNRKGGRKHLQRVKLPLGELWEKKHQPKQVEEELSGDANYPILVNYPVHSGDMIYDNYGTAYLITKEKKVLMSHTFSDTRKGWNIIYEGLPSVQGDFVIARKENLDLMLLHYDSEQKTITIQNLSTNESSRVSFAAPSQSGRKFFFHQGYFYLYSSGAGMLWQIDFQAKMEKVNERGKNIFEINKERETALDTKYENLFTKVNILKNIYRVYVNQRGYLVFNKHELHLDSREDIRIVQGKGMEIVHSAERISEGLFRFKDGSEVEVNRSGFIILRSSHRNYSNIYVPTTIKRPIGLATKELCAGEFFYEKSNLSKIILEDAGSNSLAVAEILDKEISLDFKMVRNISRNIVPQMIGVFDTAKVKYIIHKLEARGAKALSTNINPRIQTRIDNKTFFNTHIKNFIQHIIDNAT